MPTFSRDVSEAVLDLLWSQLGELGVASVVPRRHSDEYLDIEALILFIALEGAMDSRLRDESLDWLVRYGAYVSKTRLKNLRAAWDVEDNKDFGRYAATVNKYAGLGWPSGARPLAFQSRSRDLLKDFSQPSLIALRIRGTFGVGARAELMRAFLASPAFATAAALAAETNYGKRNVLNALEALRLASVVETMRVGNADQFRPVRTAGLIDLVTPIPRTFRPWNRIFGCLLRLLREIRAAERRSELERAVAATRFVDEESLRFREANLYLPPLPAGTEAWRAFGEWASREVRSLAG